MIRRVYDINIFLDKKEDQYYGVEHEENRYEKEKKKRQSGQEKERNNVQDVYSCFRGTS